MEPSFKNLLLRILTVMGYQDKEKYATDFGEMNSLDALMNCLEMLPEPVQNQVKNKEIDIQEVIKALPKDLYVQELTKVSVKALFNILDQMKTVLSNEKKHEIINIICSY